MRLGQDVLHALPAALGSEWLLPNGLGGSASGTAAGAGTRRTHAWLVHAAPHGALRTLLLGVDERLRLAGASFDLSCRPLAPDRARPAGHLLLESFELAPFPTWTWAAQGVRIERTLFTIAGHNATVLRWRHLEGPDAQLAVSPLLVARGPEALQRETDAAPVVHAIPGRARIELAPEPPHLTLWHSGSLLPARLWRSVVHAAEDGTSEAAFVPGHVEAALTAGGELLLVASSETDLFRTLAGEGRLGTPPPKTLAECVAALERGERAQRTAWIEAALLGADLTAHQARTAHAADGPAPDTGRRPLIEARDGWSAALSAQLLAGLVRRPHRVGIVNALPHAVERGADALRIVPALLAIRAFDVAREVLRATAEYLDEGVAPAWFDPADGTPHYGDPEPALWLVHDTELFARRTGDLEFARTVLMPACESVIQFHRGGTRHAIRTDADGLLASGAAGVKSAALNALWFHALVAMAQLARTVGRKEHGAFYLAWAREHQQRFNDTFWDEAESRLFDRIEGDRPVAGCAPAHVLAASLTPALLTGDRPGRMVATLERELLTPFGLREAPGATRIEPRWIGPFASAYLRANERSAPAQAVVHDWYRALRGARREAGGALPQAWTLGADGRRTPAGDPVCIVTAAELLRAWVEDVEHAGEAAALEHR